MPGWHQSTKQLVEEGKLQVAGIVQEQHPDRAALYMQWQNMTWPLLSDPFNELGISAVPITLLIDKSGIIRYRNPKKKDLTDFLANEYAAKGLLSQEQPKVAKDIATLEAKIKETPKDARSHFALGVAYRQRHDSDKRQVSDFAKAVKSWQRALKLNPNQYIWRRRIQQYGPRLDKPYSFYDWVTKAREELVARGEKPLPLVAEPSGAEFAKPQRGSGEKSEAKHPDPKGLIDLDKNSLVVATQVEVPSTDHRKSARRFHLTLKPSAQTNWTNDAGDLEVHLPEDSPVEIRNLSVPPTPKLETSTEERIIEFEIHPKKGQVFPHEFEVALFYYVCTKSDATCHFLRQDLTLPIASDN